MCIKLNDGVYGTRYIIYSICSPKRSAQTMITNDSLLTAVSSLLISGEPVQSRKPLRSKVLAVPTPFLHQHNCQTKFTTRVPFDYFLLYYSNELNSYID